MASRTPNGFLVFLGSLAAVLIVMVIFTVSIATGSKPGDLDQKRAKQRSAVREKIEKEAHDLLASEGFVDKAKGIVHVPVDSILALSAKELSAKKPAPSQIKVEAPLPMPVVDPNSTEPPMPAMPSAPQGADTIHFVAPEAPKPSASIAQPAAPIASATPARPPLINFTESK
jgi:hypothetical protein